MDEGVIHLAFIHDFSQFAENGQIDKRAITAMAVQLFDEEFAQRFDFDVLDATKLIPEEILPLHVVGRMDDYRPADSRVRSRTFSP